jgi:hypothetical protein
MNMTPAQKTAFVHTPKQLNNAIFVHPTATKALFHTLFDAAKSQPWWNDGVGYVGNDNGTHYFQIIGYPAFAALTI